MKRNRDMQKALNNGLFMDSMGYINGLNGATIDDYLQSVNGYLAVPFEGKLYSLSYKQYNSILMDADTDGNQYHQALKLQPLVDHLSELVEMNYNAGFYASAAGLESDLIAAQALDLAVQWDYLNRVEEYVEDLEMSVINEMILSNNELLEAKDNQEKNTMDTYILNIGLHTSLNFADEVYTLEVNHVLSELDNLYLTTEAYRVEQSDTEPTLVVTVQGRLPLGIEAEVSELSDILMQDCIALYHVETQTGQLLGRHSEAWGSFNPKYFMI